MTTNLTEKLTDLLQEIQEIEGISIAPEDNKLAYLRYLAGINWELLLENMILNLETISSFAQAWLLLNKGSAVPDLSAIAGCSAVLQSGGNRAYNGRTYADWVTVPPNTTSSGGVSTPITISANYPPYWQGTKIVVQSNKPTFRMSDEDTTVYNTGEVYTISLDEDFSISPSIEGEGTIIVYVCVDALSSVPLCTAYHSTYEGGSSHYVRWPEGGTGTDPNGVVRSTFPVVRLGNFNGYSFRRSDAYPTKVYFLRYWLTNGGAIQSHGIGYGETWVLPVDTYAIMLDSSGTGGYDEFEAYICRP